MKVIEFKLRPTKAAIASWEYQLHAYKAVWNSALALHIEADARYWMEKNGLAKVCSGAVVRRQGNKVVDGKPTQWRNVLSGIRRPTEDKPILEKGEVIGTIAGPYCCVRKLQGVSPLDKSIEVDGVKVTSAISRTSSMANYPWMNDDLVDSRYLTGVFKSLKVAWKSYKDGVRKRPRFKGKKDKLKSLSNGSGLGAKAFMQIGEGNNGYVKFPKLKEPVCCKGLFKRYRPNDMQIGTVKVCKKADGWYMQVTYKNPPEDKVKPSDKAVGLDPGVKQNLTTDTGKVFHCKQDARLDERIRKLQRKASRQYLMNKDSNGHSRTQKEIARLKGKQARSRKAWQHKISSRIVSEFGVIAIEDTKLKNMTRKPKAKPNESGGFDPNGAAAKAGLNKAILRSSMGGLRMMLDAKSKAAKRQFVKVPAAFTSARCNACGYKHSKEQKPLYRPTQDKFVCQSCGHTGNADTNAAKNILDDGLIILRNS
jgi:transposase